MTSPCEMYIPSDKSFENFIDQINKSGLFDVQKISTANNEDTWGGLINLAPQEIARRIQGDFSEIFVKKVNAWLQEDDKGWFRYVKGSHRSMKWSAIVASVNKV